MRKYIVGVLFSLIVVLNFSCSKDEEIPSEGTNEKTNEWIYSVMSSYYLWYGDMKAKDKLDFSKEPEAFFSSLISDSDGVTFNGNRLIFSTIEKKETNTKTISGEDTYGFDFASYKTTEGKYYAWVLYVLPGSPAEKAGIKRGDWIVAENSKTPNITDKSDLISGGATKFTLAYYKEEAFHFSKEVSIEASQVTEASPILKDSVYTIGGNKIGYLMYNSFVSGPNNENTTYDNEMKEVFQNFKSQNVNEFVLDLRYNGGGLVTSAQLLSSLLAPVGALGNTFCKFEYNDKHTKDNKDMSFLTLAKLNNGNLALKRLVVLVGQTTASASEAVINCLAPYMGRENIRIIGERTIGKPVGSVTFGEDKDYGWLLHPIIFRIYNKEGKADYVNGFTPDEEVKELKVGNDLLPLGDTNELLFKEGIAWINGSSVKCAPETKSAPSGLKFAGYSFERKQTQGLILKD